MVQKCCVIRHFLALLFVFFFFDVRNIRSEPDGNFIHVIYT